MTTGQLQAETRVLITGATGFVGRNLARALLARGCHVTVLVRDPARLDTSGARVVTGDLADPDSFERFDAPFDVVFNCAGLLGSWDTKAADMQAVNANGPVTLAHKLSQPPRCFVQVSTVGVSGPLTELGDENTPCHPVGPYQATKLAGEQQLLQEAASSGLPVIIARPSFTYGPGDTHKLALFRAVKKRRFAFVGGGTSILHPLFIDDLVAGIQLCAVVGQAGQAYIIGGERPVPVRELVNEIADAVDVPHPRLSLPVPLARLAATVFELAGNLTNRPPPLTQSRVTLMSSNYGYSIAKAQSQLGYAPSVDLTTGIRRTVAAYQETGLM